MSKEKKEVLPDLLCEGLKIVFCGTSVPWKSFKNRAYYASEGNCFYDTLKTLNFTPVLIESQNYQRLLSYGIGLTDLAKYKVGSDKDLKPEDFDIPALLEKIEKYKPQILCFNGKRAAAEFYGFGDNTRRIEYGQQKLPIGNTKVFVTYSTAENARKGWKQDVWEQLKDMYDKSMP